MGVNGNILCGYCLLEKKVDALYDKFECKSRIPGFLVYCQCYTVFIYLFIYLFIEGFVQSSTGTKTIGHKSPTRFKLQSNPLLKY